MSLTNFLVLSSILFAIGLTGAIVRRSILVVYMSLEMMLIASTLALISFAKYTNTMDGAVFCFFIIALAAAEVAVGLALIVAYYRKRQSASLDEMTALKY